MGSAEDARSVAVIGFSCRVPGASDWRTFWDNLDKGVESIRTFTPSELRKAGVPEALLTNPRFVPRRPVVEGIELFDAAFFGLTPREAELMDPQHRWMLEDAWSAIEDAGYAPDKLHGTVGVFAGSGLNTYLMLNLISRMPRVGALADSMDTIPFLVTNEKDYLSTRLSYSLGLKGPSVSVQSACSTSLVAVHLATQSLLSGECDMALAGGVKITTDSVGGYLYQEGGAFSADGRCRAFDAGATGSLFGSGIGVVVLKRLADALEHRDAIRAVIRGSAVNNDGAMKVGFTAPSVQGQTRVLSEALAVAGVNPREVDYVETHGTGTPLGDAIEVTALKAAYHSGDRGGRPCRLGAVKANIGHLEAASGVVGLIKACLCLERGAIPPALHFERPNPAFDFGDLRVERERHPWPAGTRRRYAGVSSFGVGGTNAHVVLEEAPVRQASSTRDRPQLVVLSARSKEALAQSRIRLGAQLGRQPRSALTDVAHTLQRGRSEFPERMFAVCKSVEELRNRLLVRGGFREETASRTEPPVAFLLPGAGSFVGGMGSELYQNLAIFRQSLDACLGQLEFEHGLALRDVLYPPRSEPRDQAAARRPLVSLACLFSVEYALAQQWLALGVRPTGGLIGHSLGEHVAACLANVLSLSDALRLVVARGRLLETLPEGAMLLVPRSEEQVRDRLPAELSLAAVNSPDSCVVSGPVDAVRLFRARLADEQISATVLPIAAAGHSSMTDHILGAFEAEARRVRWSAPQIPFVSNVTGKWITAAEATDPVYWTSHLRQPVRFAEGLRALAAGSVLLELGPSPGLAYLAQRLPAEQGPRAVVCTLPDPRPGRDDRSALLAAIGELWVVGVPIRWDQVWGEERPHRVSLPSYPFQRERYWVERCRPDNEEPTGSHPLILSVSSWQRVIAPLSRPEARAQIVVLGAEEPWLARVADMCEAQEHHVTRVVRRRPGPAAANAVHVVDPEDPEQLEAMLRSVPDRESGRRLVLHGWLLDGAYLVDAPDLLSTTQGALTSVDVAASRGWDVAVLTRTAAAVTGDERPIPAAAVAAQWLAHRGAPTEGAGMVRSIDVGVGAAELSPELIEAVTDDILCAGGPASVAYRGATRWVQCREIVEPVSSPVPSEAVGRGACVVLGSQAAGTMGLALQFALERGATLVTFGPLGEVWDPQLARLSGVDFVRREAPGDGPALERALEEIALAHGGIDMVLWCPAQDSAEATLTSELRALRACLRSRPRALWVVVSQGPKVSLASTLALAEDPKAIVLQWDAPSTASLWGVSLSASLRRLRARGVMAVSISARPGSERATGAPRFQSKGLGPAVSEGPQGDVETIVSEVWREVLGRSSIARTDNFFSLGGNSLSASQVVVRVREAFEVDFPLRSFLLEPTVAAMAETITASLIGEVSVAPRKDVP